MLIQWNGIQNYKNGILDGEYKDYYSFGQLLSKRKYIEGNLEGVYLDFYKNGQSLNDFKASYWFYDNVALYDKEQQKFILQNVRSAVGNHINIDCFIGTCFWVLFHNAGISGKLSLFLDN